MRAVGHREAPEAPQSLGFRVGSCICLILSAVFAMRTLGGVVPGSKPVPAERINPNEAPAVSLARLPGIGPSRADAIVALRSRLRTQAEGEPVFRTAEDLGQVRGIGPATIEGIRPWLRFDPRPGEGDGPAGE